MSSIPDLLAHYQELLAEFDPGLPGVLAGALERLPPTLAPEEIAEWAGLAVELSDRAPPAAGAFLRATPEFLTHRSGADLREWATQGGRFCRGTWKSAELAERFFASAAALVRALSAEEMAMLTEVLLGLAERSVDLAASCLDRAPDLFASLDGPDRPHFIDLADRIVSTTWSDAWHYFESGAAQLEAVTPAERSGFLQLIARISDGGGEPVLELFRDTTAALGQVDAGEQGRILNLAGRLAANHARAAAAFLASSPFLRSRISLAAMEDWVAYGETLAGASNGEDAVESFFRIETAGAEQLLGSLSGRVDIEHVGTLLRLYATALGGEHLLVQSTRTLTDRMIGWVREDAASTEGTTVFVPPSIDHFGDQHTNLQMYKVCIAHQASRLAFGSFSYRYGQEGAYLDSSATRRERALIEPLHPDGTPMHRFFDLFPERKLIGDLFAIAEDARIDAEVAQEYRGLRTSFARARDHAMTERPEFDELGLRETFVENLLRASLGHPERIRWPEPGIGGLADAIALVMLVREPGATVADAAETAALLYDLAILLPNFPAALVTQPWVPLPQTTPADSPIARIAARTAEWADGRWWRDAATAVALAQPYRHASLPFFRGGFKPELVQALTALREGVESITSDQLRHLLENSEEIEGDAVDIDLLLDHLESERMFPDGEDDEDAAPEPDEEEVTIDWSFYDEWDFRANDYRPSWCHVGERRAREGDAAYYDRTLRRHHALVGEIRRQFELMRPEIFRKLKRLEDGHEIELDQAIEFQVDKRAGSGPLARFYSRRDKVERNVAVAFLLDMSASTEEEIADHTGMAKTEPAQRIIDLERESAVLIVEALEAVGDSYGIYGFSGQGRKHVAFHVIKEIDEEFDDLVKTRIDSIEPLRGTRMGAAIRHAQAKLLGFPAKVRILMLVSDGRPQDHGYGIDRGDTDYGVHDTKQALVEGKREGIVPFLITVDKEGPDYLKEMCADIDYEVVANVESLPERLPRIYRQLARG